MAASAISLQSHCCTAISLVRGTGTGEVILRLRWQMRSQAFSAAERGVGTKLVRSRQATELHLGVDKGLAAGAWEKLFRRRLFGRRCVELAVDSSSAAVRALHEI